MTRAQATVVEERGACALYLSPGISVSPDDVEAGFRWLESWDVLMPLMSYERLAEYWVAPGAGAHASCSVKATVAVVKDMRQMVYDERVMFIRHGIGLALNSVGSSADELLTARNEESCEDDDCPLPMLRAIWRAKPLLLALPTAWVSA